MTDHSDGSNLSRESSSSGMKAKSSRSVVGFVSPAGEKACGGRGRGWAQEVSIHHRLIPPLTPDVQDERRVGGHVVGYGSS